MSIFAGEPEKVNLRFDVADRSGLLPILPHRMTASDFTSRSVNDWIHCFFDGFEEEVGNEATTAALAESRAILASRGVQLSGDEPLGELCDQLAPDEQLAIWRRSLGLDKKAA